MANTLFVSKGANHPTSIVNLDQISGAWVEPSYKLDKSTYDLSERVDAYIKEKVEKEPNKVTDDLRLMQIVEEGLNNFSDDYMSTEEKVQLRCVLLDKYHGKVSDDHKVMVNIHGSKWEVAVCETKAEAEDVLCQIMAKMDPNPLKI